MFKTHQLHMGSSKTHTWDPWEPLSNEGPTYKERTQWEPHKEGGSGRGRCGKRMLVTPRRELYQLLCPSQVRHWRSFPRLITRGPCLWLQGKPRALLGALPYTSSDFPVLTIVFSALTERSSPCGLDFNLSICSTPLCS